MKYLGLKSSFLLALVSVTASVFGQEPGDVYNEFRWRPSKWQRVIGHDATNITAKSFLPNQINTIIIGDLVDAIRVEVQIEKLTSHAGTVKPMIKINGNAWLTIPGTDRSLVPGTRGTYKTYRYLAMYYPKVSVPLSYLKTGTNKFEFTCQGNGASGALAKVWPQYLIYGVNFRIYYDPAKKPHSTGEIIAPRSGGVLYANPKIQASVTGSVNRVDFFGDYNDFNWRGDGTTTGWQYDYHYNVMQHHIGHTSRTPYKVTWDTTWIPSQSRPFRIAARIRGSDGIYYITPAVTGISLNRSDTVVRYSHSSIPKDWITNSFHPMKEAFTVIPSLAGATTARMFARTWNGVDAEEIGINATRVSSYIGNKSHDIDWTETALNLSILKEGTNSIYTKGTSKEHGIEVLWPGLEIFVRYNIPEAKPEFVTFGKGCGSATSTPTLTVTGTPKLGSTFSLVLSGAPANALTFMSWGVSNEYHLVTQLPLELSVFGAPGCSIWSSMDVLTTGAANASGTETLRFDLPVSTGLIGKVFFNQSIVADPSANTAGLIVTNSTRILVGR